MVKENYAKGNSLPIFRPWLHATFVCHRNFRNVSMSLTEKSKAISHRYSVIFQEYPSDRQWIKLTTSLWKDTVILGFLILLQIFLKIAIDLLQTNFSLTSSSGEVNIRKVRKKIFFYFCNSRMMLQITFWPLIGVPLIGYF